MDRVLASYPLLTSVACIVLVGALLERVLMFTSRNQLPLAGKNVLIAGGSQGLGLCLANLLTKRGAHVTIVARTQSKLDAALEEIKTYRKDPSQRVLTISADLTSQQDTVRLFGDYAEVNGVPCPDYVFCCAGGAGRVLGLFADLSPEQLSEGMRTNYDTALWTSHTATRLMVEHGIQGKIILVSSLMGLFTFAGYAAYAPAKYALRGLADCLRNEFLLYGITIHCYFPGTIFTPGLEAENKIKPQLTKDIEGPEEGKTPEVLAQALVKGLEKGQFLVTTDPIGHLFRNNSRGVSPSFHGITDLFWTISAMVGIPVWRWIADGHVQRWRKKRDHAPR